MKKFNDFLLPLNLVISSCKKSANEFTPPPGKPNPQVDAVVSVKGSPFASFLTSGNATDFSRVTDANGDLLIGITGANASGQVDITLVNITAPGVYTMGSSGEQYVLGAFEIGNALAGPYEFFSAWPPPAVTSSIIIDELTATTIRGRFCMTCNGNTGTVQVTNGNFSGIF